ncbi:hypothetical protein L3X38_025891 [Prunus dulcis]|uniref:Uncharacterized protein n=1 Tax=Prunus dulcis TaxID=3755 RepID=A0AAD4W4E8_PRUDU|nr:hypothetical protein L3X38_025891 [Prunus dulcis]
MINSMASRYSAKHQAERAINTDLYTLYSFSFVQLEYTKKQGTEDLHSTAIFKIGYTKKQGTKHLDSAIIFKVLAIILLLHTCWYKCLTNFLITAVDIDSIISAELPDKTVNNDLYDIVTQFMIHGSDRARVVFQDNQQDEILAYLNCRYISPYEAVWRVTSRQGLKILIENNQEVPNNYTKNIVYKDVLQNL